MKKRTLSMMLILCLTLTWLPAPAAAADANGLCIHHTVHDQFCGYVDAVAGAPCTHEHTDDCYHVATGEAKNTSDADDDEAVSADDTELGEMELDCQHVHDSSCGYIEPVEGQACTYVCEICNSEEQYPSELDLFAVPMTVGASNNWDGSIAGSYAGGSGTTREPYLISTAEQLARVADQVNSGVESGKSYRLLNDIYLNDISEVSSWDIAAPQNEWIPIGSSSTQFSGSFDGGGFTVFGIYILTDNNNQGLFGVVGKDSPISNLHIKESYIKGGDCVGGVCGYTSSGLSNCHSNATVVGNDHVGGIVGGGGNPGGLFGGSPVLVENCSNDGTVNGISGVGGLLGRADTGVLKKCYNTGSVTGTRRIGGIAGRAVESHYCWNAADITGNDMIGGILGEGIFFGMDSPELLNCFNAGHVSGKDYIGGLLGRASQHSGLYPSAISNCYNVGQLTGSGDYIGGIAGDGAVCKYTNCYNAGSCSLGDGKNTGAIFCRARQGSGNLYFLEGCCGANYWNGWSEVSAKSSAEMQESSFVSTMNNGGSAWVQDTEGYNSGYPILSGIDYGVYAQYIKKPVGVSKSGNFTYTSTMLTGNDMDRDYKYTYDETWFSKDSTDYQHDLTKMSMCIALAAYGANSDGNARNIRALMEDLEFKELDIHYPCPECDVIPDPAATKPPDTIGYVIGSKNIVLDSGEDCSLVMVAIRGGGYGVEWGANFRIGTEESGVHEGFNIAKKQVIEGIQEYFKKNKLSSNCKIWISGYSRGGATTNLVAAALDDGVTGVEVDKKDIYAFCFECPRTIRIEDELGVDRLEKEYDNIVNIINAIDFVPKVAMESWDYIRYGKDYYLPFVESTYNYSYSDLTQRMLAEYQHILSDPNKDGTVPKLEYDYSYYEVKGQATILDDFMENLAFAMTSPAVYTNKYQEDMISIFKRTLGGDKDQEVTWDSLIIPGFFLVNFHPVNTLKTIGLFSVNFDGLYKYGALYVLLKEIDKNGPAACAHYPELCLAWLNALDGEHDYASPLYRKLFVNCPVDISVYDSNRHLVAQIANDAVQEIDGGLVTYIDDNEQKVIALPNGEEYTIELTATDNGSVTYTVTEYNIDSSTTEKVVSYYEIDVSNGDKLTGIVENLDEVSTPSYPLYLNDESIPLNPTITQDDVAVTEYNVEITVSGNGNAYGSGTYVNGTFAKVIAATDSNEEFQGWYLDNSLVSTEDEYRFLVDKDIHLVAKFGESPSTDTYVLTVVDGTGSGSCKAGTKISISANAAPKGKRFDKWITDGGGIFADMSSASTIFTMPAGNVTVTATYKDISNIPPVSGIYTITFDPTGGTVTPATATTEASGKLTTLFTPIRDDFTFDGWYTAASGGEEVSTNHVFTADTTIFAHWSRNTSDGNDRPNSSEGGGSGTSTYAVSVPREIPNGKVTVSPRNAAKGKTVTITVTPDDGYELDKLAVTDKNGDELRLTDTGDGKYTFTMPAGKVEVEAVFKEISTEPEQPAPPATPSTPHPFTDVPAGEWYAGAVQYVYDKGMMTGVTPTTFGPSVTTNRAMIVTMLYRLENEPAAGASSFSDVPANEWYTDAVAWASANGIVNGTTPSTFSPLTPITREQMAAILFRYASFKGYDVGNRANLYGYTDMNQISEYALIAMQWANAEGLITGTTSTTLEPAGSATRAQVATILMRFCENVAK